MNLHTYIRLDKDNNLYIRSRNYDEFEFLQKLTNVDIEKFEEISMVRKLYLNFEFNAFNLFDKNDNKINKHYIHLPEKLPKIIQIIKEVIGLFSIEKDIVINTKFTK